MFLDFAVNRHHITAEQIAKAKKKKKDQDRITVR